MILVEFVRRKSLVVIFCLNLFLDDLHFDDKKEVFTIKTRLFSSFPKCILNGLTFRLGLSEGFPSTTEASNGFLSLFFFSELKITFGLSSEKIFRKASELIIRSSGTSKCRNMALLCFTDRGRILLPMSSCTLPKISANPLYALGTWKILIL